MARMAANHIQKIDQIILKCLILSGIQKKKINEIINNLIKKYTLQSYFDIKIDHSKIIFTIKFPLNISWIPFQKIGICSFNFTSV